MKTIYFSRHGKRIDRHAPRQWKRWHQRCKRWYDPPITEENISELDEQAKTIDKLDAIYCSPFLRCVQTAHVYACRLQCPVYIEHGMGENLRQSWFERGGMECEGVPDFPDCLWKPEILKYTYYTVDLNHENIYKDYKFPESRRDCMNRVAYFCQYLKDNSKFENIMVIGHGTSTKDARVFFGYPDGNFPPMGVLSSINL